MQAFTTHTGTAVALRRSNVDTDQIIPAAFLKRVTRTGFEDGLFAAWRGDTDFVLNRPESDGASILVAGTDFGIGSSREHAVWALQDYGFRVVLSPRFGDIFRSNAGKSGLLAAQADSAVVESVWALVEREPRAPVVVDLQARSIVAGEGAQRVEGSFDVDDYTRWRLLEGLDDVDITLSHASDVEAYERRRARWRPTTLPQRTEG